jgi:hypothetical protein
MGILKTKIYMGILDIVGKPLMTNILMKMI